MDFPRISRILEFLPGGAWGSQANDRVSIKAAKAELLQMVEEQERAWMSMRYSMEELERRLRIMEIEKAQFEDILQLRIMSRSLGTAEECSVYSSPDSPDSLVDYSSFYVSKIFEDRNVVQEVGKPKWKRLQRQLTFLSDVAEEQETHNWKTEVHKLRGEVSRLEEELRLATEQQVTVDVLDDAPEDMSDVASSSQISQTSTPHHGEDENIRLRGSMGDFEWETASFSGQLSETFLMQANRLKGLHSAFKKRGPEKSGLVHVQDSLIDLLTELSRELASLCGNLQTDLLNENSGCVAPSVACLEAALAGLKSSGNGGVGKVQTEYISELEETVKAQKNYLDVVLENHAVEVQRKDNTLKFAQQLNSKLAADLTRVEAELAEVRSRNKGLQASMEVHLKDARQALAKQPQPSRSETKILELERLLADKDAQLHEVRKKMLSAQSETDATAMEKIDLLEKLRDARKEVDGCKERIKQLLTINKEALKFAQSKEEEAARIRLQYVGCGETLQDTSETCSRLSEELNEARKLLKAAEEDKQKQGQQHRAFKERVRAMEYEMRQREDALERLTKHLASLEKERDTFFPDSLRFQHTRRHKDIGSSSISPSTFRQSQ